MYKCWGKEVINWILGCKESGPFGTQVEGHCGNFRGVLRRIEVIVQIAKFAKSQLGSSKTSSDDAVN